MEIKCPIPYCRKVYKIDLSKIRRGTYNHWMYGGNITVLQRHLREKHKDELYFIVTSQIVKIHEKIEEIENLKPATTGLNYMSSSYAELQRNLGKLQVLKSLLENEMK